MVNPLHEKIKESLNEGSFFLHSITDLALQRLEGLDRTQPINILITGDRDLYDIAVIMRNIVSFLRYFEDRENFRILTGDRKGVETVVRKAVKANNIDHYVFRTEDEDWREDKETKAHKRDIAMVNRADVVFFITRGNVPETDSMYRLARDNGLVVSRRNIRRKA